MKLRRSPLAVWASATLDFIALTHAHWDHAGACAPTWPVRWSCASSELDDPGRAVVAGLLPLERLRLLSGDEGELVEGSHLERAPSQAQGSVGFERKGPPRGSSCSPATPSGGCATTFETFAGGDDAGSDPVLAHLLA